MTLRTLRVGTGLLLVTAGALMCAASWQRWAGACAWGQAEGDRCLSRQDHRYDFVAPTVPWEPVGAAAQLAGASLLVLAIAFALLPWALIGRRPGRIARFAFSSRGWTLATCIALALGTPLVAAVSYAVGPYDAQPWWEAISGVFTATGGLCLLVAAVLGTRQGDQDDADVAAVASPPLANGAAARDGRRSSRRPPATCPRRTEATRGRRAPERHGLTAEPRPRLVTGARRYSCNDSWAAGAR